MSFLRIDVDDIVFSIKCFQDTHGGLLPQKIVMNPTIYADLKAEVEEKDGVWNDNYFGVPIEVDKNAPELHFLGPVRLKHRVCPFCGWIDKRENFNHQLDYVNVCDHCFENFYIHKNVDDKWRRQVNEHNKAVRNEMDENYLETYGEILFGEYE